MTCETREAGLTTEIEAAQRRGDHEKAQALYLELQGVEDVLVVRHGNASERLRPAAIEGLERRINKALAGGDHAEANRLYLRQTELYAEEITND